MDNDVRARTWGKARGLKMLDSPYGNTYSPRHLIDKKTHDNELRELEREDSTLMLIFNHARFFVLLPARAKAGVMLTTPYQQTILSRIESLEHHARRVNEIANNFGLMVRIGRGSDDIYWSASPHQPTLPIV